MSPIFTCSASLTNKTQTKKSIPMAARSRAEIRFRQRNKIMSCHGAKVLWAFSSCTISLFMAPKDRGSNPHWGNVHNICSVYFEMKLRLGPTFKKSIEKIDYLTQNSFAALGSRNALLGQLFTLLLRNLLTRILFGSNNLPIKESS